MEAADTTKSVSNLKQCQIPRKRSVKRVSSPVDKEEQERTTVAKKLFLEFLDKSRGNITTTCMKIEKSRAIYYHWRNTDEQFKESADEILNSKPEILEDRLYNLALEGNLQALLIMLKHKHPDYKEQQKESRSDIHYHVHKSEESQNVTLEDMIDFAEMDSEQAAELIGKLPLEQQLRASAVLRLKIKDGNSNNDESENNGESV